jgi:two-component system response regulator YesN
MNKYRVLVADDEPLTLQTMKMVIGKVFSDRIEKILLAKTGTEAVEVALGEKPDLVLMDIRMPGMDGLEAIARIKPHLPNAMFVVVSAYDEFGYAHRALETGVSRYILKPISKSTIIDFITTSLDTLDEERKGAKTAIEQEQLARRMLPYLESQFVYSLVFDAYCDVQDLDDFADVGDGADLKGRVLIIDIDPKDHTLTEEMAIMDSRIFKTLKSRLMRICRCALANLSLSRYIAVVLDDAEDFEKALGMSGYKMRIGIGRKYTGVKQMHTSYLEAAAALHKAQWGQAVCFNDALSLAMKTDKYPYDAEKAFIEALSQADEARCVALFGQVLQWFIDKPPYCFNTVKNGMTQLAIPMVRVGVDKGSEFSRSVLETQDYLDYYMSINSLSRLREWFMINIAQRCKVIAQYRKDAGGSIAKLRAEIERDYSRKLSLAEAAAIVNLSPTYFSYYIKKLSGQTYVEFAMDIKMKKAKELLRTTQTSIKEIAYDLGFSSANYFCRLFKKYVGETPNVYRKSTDG